MEGGKLCRVILANPPRTSNSCWRRCPISHRYPDFITGTLFLQVCTMPTPAGMPFGHGELSICRPGARCSPPIRALPTQTSSLPFSSRNAHKVEAWVYDKKASDAIVGKLPLTLPSSSRASARYAHRAPSDNPPSLGPTPVPTPTKSLNAQESEYMVQCSEFNTLVMLVDTSIYFVYW